MAASLDNVKDALGITGSYQDATLTVYINEVVSFLKDAGVSESNITDGIVARGVAIFDMFEIGDGIKAIQCSAEELWDAYQTQTVLIRWAYTADNRGHPIQYSWIYQVIFAQLQIKDSGEKSYWFQTNNGDAINFYAENDSYSPASK